MKKLQYLFGLIILLKNWPAVLVRFLFKFRGEGEFRFRSGLVMHYSQWIEIEEIIGTFVRQDYGTVSPDSIVVDIGASLGSFSLYAAQQGAKVLAFEPSPASFEILSRNIQLNSWQDRISSLRQGIGGRAGKRDFFVSKLSPLSSLYGGKGEKTTVDCTTLEDIFKEHHLPRLDILKLDCEGAEYEILYRTPAEILRKIKEIRLEYHVLPAEGEARPWRSLTRSARLGRLGKRTNPEGLTDFLLRQGFTLVHQRRDAPISGLLWFKRLSA